MRKLSAIFVVLMLFVSVTPVLVRGHASEGTDRIFRMADVARLEQYLAGMDVDIDREAMDVNGDGVLTREDAVLLRAFLAGHTDDIILPAAAPQHALGPMFAPMSANEIVLRVQVSNTNPAPGGYVDVAIYIDDNPGVWFFDMWLAFDADRFELRDPTATIEYSDMLPPLPGAVSPLPLNGFFTDDLTNSGYTGLLATVHFRVRDGAAPGNVDFNLLGEIQNDFFDTVTPVGILSQTVTVGFGDVPPTGVPDITWAITAMFAFFALFVMSLGGYFLNRKSRMNNG